MVFSLLFGGAAQAGLTTGVGLGGLMDLPGGPFTCEGTYPQYEVVGVEATTGEGCKKKPRFGGQLVVPFRIHLGQMAAIKLVPGVQATTYNGAVGWKGTPEGSPPNETEYGYQGYTAFALRPNLAVGGELAFSPKGITPYIGATVSAGLVWDVHSLGVDGDGKHVESMGAYDLRNDAQSSSPHCNLQFDDRSTARNGEGECRRDAERMGFAFGGELAVGVRTADPSRPGFFVEGVFNTFSIAASSPKNYPEFSEGAERWVELGPSKINPFGLTAGLLIPL